MKPEGVKPRFELRAAADGAALDFIIYGEIGGGFWGDEGITAQRVIDALQARPDAKTINVYMNSPGGQVLEALAIYNALARHAARVIVTVDGMAASSASVVAMAGDEIRVAENGFVMIHDPSDVLVGTADEFRHAADVLDKATTQIVATYTARTRLPESEVRAMMAAETWMTGAEAKAKGFATEIVPAKRMAACWDGTQLKTFKKVPDAARALAAVVAVVPADVSPQGAVIKESHMVETKETAPADNQPKAATLAELKAALDGAPADFLLACLEKTQTVGDALRDYNRKLVADGKVAAEAQQKELADLKAKLEAPKVPATKGVGTATKGGQRQAEEGSLEAEVERDFLATAKAYQLEKNLKSVTAAMSLLAGQYPEAHRVWVASLPPVKRSGGSLPRIA